MDVGSVYGSYYETAKSYMGLRKEEKQAGFAEKVTDKSQVSSEDMTLEEYKEYFNGCTIYSSVTEKYELGY